jgi:hypothetical protein
VSPQSLGGPAASSGGAPTGATSSAGGGGAPPPRHQRVRARRGQATDPHSIAERVSHLSLLSSSFKIITLCIRSYIYVGVIKHYCKPSTSLFAAIAYCFESKSMNRHRSVSGQNG